MVVTIALGGCSHTFNRVPIPGMWACYKVTVLRVRTGTHQQPDGSSHAHVLRHHISACVTLTSGQGAVQERERSLVFAKLAFLGMFVRCQPLGSRQPTQMYFVIWKTFKKRFELNSFYYLKSNEMDG